MLGISGIDLSIEDRILESAREEFLDKGFEKSSLRLICKKAGVTTGAFYRRYKDKNELFKVIVAPVILQVEELSREIESLDYLLLEESRLGEIWARYYENYRSYLELIYGNYEIVKLLVSCAEGSEYENFLGMLVNQNTDQTMRFLGRVREEGYEVKDISRDELQILLSACWSAIFQIVVNDFPREKAEIYVETLREFFNWKAVLGF